MVLSARPALAGLTVVLVLSGGCSTLFPPGPDEVLGSIPPPVAEAGYRARFSDGTASVTEVSVWRNPEPLAGRRSPCAELCASVRLRSTGFDVSALQVTELWVVRGSSGVRFGQVVAEPDLPGVTVRGQRGPRLGQGDQVVIVARVQRSDGRERLVRSPQVPVEVRG